MATEAQRAIDFLKLLKANKTLNYSEMASRLGVTKQYISKILKGNNVAGTMVDKIKLTFPDSVDYINGVKDNPISTSENATDSSLDKKGGGVHILEKVVEDYMSRNKIIEKQLLEKEKVILAIEQRVNALKKVMTNGNSGDKLDNIVKELEELLIQARTTDSEIDDIRFKNKAK